MLESLAWLLWPYHFMPEQLVSSFAAPQGTALFGVMSMIYPATYEYNKGSSSLLEIVS